MSENVQRSETWTHFLSLIFCCCSHPASLSALQGALIPHECTHETEALTDKETKGKQGQGEHTAEALTHERTTDIMHTRRNYPCSNSRKQLTLEGCTHVCIRRNKDAGEKNNTNKQNSHRTACIGGTHACIGHNHSTRIHIQQR